ncbi:hypothetical protein ISR94_00570 [Candidatus Microgenomates bacterium]|nr:hypothetical protein [Candidatus Microgenomates bacterium]
MPKSRKTVRIKRKQRVQKTRKSIGLLYVFGVVFIISTLLFFAFKLSLLDKFSYVKETKEGGAEILVYDPKNTSVVSILIPGETQLELSFNLGDYRLKNAWKLSESEDLEGVLIVRSLVKNFSIPVYLYKTESKTNLNIFQRIKVWMLDSGTGGVSESQFDLVDTSVLKAKKLLDGNRGFVVYGEIPAYITVNFEQQSFSEFVPMVDIVDKTGDYKISDTVSGVFSTMGAKVSSYSKQPPQKLNCVVSGKNPEQVKITSKIFDCHIGQKPEGESDIRLEIGTDFVNNF